MNTLHRRALRYFGVACAAVALAWLAPVQAQVMGMHAASRHFPAHSWQSDDNGGLYLRQSSGLTVGAYRNSLRRATVYAGWTWSDLAGPVDLTVAAATGYRVAPLVPMLAVSLELAPRTWSQVPRLSLSRGTDSWVAHLSIEARF